MAKVQHIGMVKFKDGTSAEQIEKIFADLLDVTEGIPGVENYVSGVNHSPEGLSQGFTHGFVMTFQDAGARDAYLTHPDHERFKTSALPFVENIAVVDFDL